MIYLSRETKAFCTVYTAVLVNTIITTNTVFVISFLVNILFDVVADAEDIKLFRMDTNY